MSLALSCDVAATCKLKNLAHQIWSSFFLSNGNRQDRHVDALKSSSRGSDAAIDDLESYVVSGFSRTRKCAATKRENTKNIVNVGGYKRTVRLDGISRCQPGRAPELRVYGLLPVCKDRCSRGNQNRVQSYIRPVAYGNGHHGGSAGPRANRLSRPFMVSAVHGLARYRSTGYRMTSIARFPLKYVSNRPPFPSRQPWT